MEAATGTAQPQVFAPRPIYDAKEHGPAIPVTRRESAFVFFVTGIFYALVGYHVIVGLHVVPFEALDRMTRGLMVWHNNPPKLAAIGFSVSPVPTITLLPFTAFRGAVTSGLALPVSSAIFAAGALVFINRLFAIADMSRPLRFVLVTLVALNPMFVFYATNGTGVAVYMFFVAIVLYCLLAWVRTLSARFLIGGGMAMSMACLARYEFMVWALLIAFIIAAVLVSNKRQGDEVQGSVIAYAAPILYAIGLWLFFNSTVLGDPFAWIDQTRSAQVNSALTPFPAFDLGDAVANALRIQLIFPATLFVLPALAIRLFGSRTASAAGFTLLLLLAVAFPVFAAASAGRVDVIELSDALPAMLAALAGIAWLYMSSPDGRGLIAAIAVILSVIALPLAFAQMQSFPHQNLEQAFARAISTGDDQEGVGSRGGFTAGIAPERAMAQSIDGKHTGTGDILTDNARTFGVIAMTGRPELFFDRVDQGDTLWNEALADPAAADVGYLLAERSGSDRVLARYPGADSGKYSFLQVVAENDRYVLLKVLGPPTSPGTGSGPAGNATATAPGITTIPGAGPALGGTAPAGAASGGG